MDVPNSLHYRDIKDKRASFKAWKAYFQVENVKIWENSENIRGPPGDPLQPDFLVKDLMTPPP